MADLRIWFAIPTANPKRANATFAKWRQRGYKTAAFCDPGRDNVAVDLKIVAPYPGYFSATNQLCQKLLPEADIIVAAGDDIDPDLRFSAQEIGKNFIERFPDFYGVMQPVGDRGIAGVETICGSPWIGREFLRRAYGGKGPFWPDYKAFFGDQEMKEVTEKLGILWRRPDLVQTHWHWMRKDGPPKMDYQKANDRHWESDKVAYYTRQAQGFPGHAPLPVGG